MAFPYDISNFVRPYLLTLAPYASARDEYDGTEGIFLDANENPFGSPTEIALNRYPDPLQKAVKLKIAHIKKVDRKQIFLGNGSDEPIDLIIKACCEPLESEMIIMPPTYGMYKVCADIQRVNAVSVPLIDGFQIDVDGVIKAITKNTKLIWVCSPNNPTGNLLKESDIISLLEHFQTGFVVVDEAYIDFAAQKSLLSVLDKYPNLIVLQTFSKAWGLAGLRIGMAFAHPEIIQILNKIKYPYNINHLTQSAVLEALENPEWKDQKIEEILTQRSLLMASLSQIEAVEHIYPSDSNMLLVKFKNADELFDHLIQQKIILRNRSTTLHCEGCIRISVGTATENERLLRAITDFYTI